MNRQEQILAEMWAAGASAEEIGRRIGLERTTVHKWRVRLGLPGRLRNYKSVVADPTPEELERLKAEIKARNMEAMRCESEVATRSRVWKENERLGLREVPWLPG